MTQPPGSEPQTPNRMPTGIAGLDEIIDGGLPRSGITVVVGGPGSGKTTFGLQVLAAGAREGEPGIMVAFEESGERILANASGFAWGGPALSRTGVHVIDAQLAQSVETGGDFDLVGFLAILRAKVDEVGARRVVFDGIGVLLGYLAEPALVQRELFRLREWVHHGGLSAIVTSKGDLNKASVADSEFLQFIADCVVSMDHRLAQGTALRSLRVSKYRGAAHSANEIPLTITAAGLEVAANTGSRRAHAASNERVSSGVARLDAMLEGGYHRGSSVLITGAPGTAKTSLAASFAEAAARRGERTIYVSFDESPDQIVRNVASIGIDLAPLVGAGVLQIHSLRARSQSPEAHVAWVRALLRDRPPRNLVLDPISALTQRGCESEAEAAALQVLDIAKNAGITLVSTSLTGNLQPLLEHTPYRISTIADTWMHVSYEIRAGERNRAITVIKSRGTAHSNQVRELILSRKGVTLANVNAVGGEVLMGTLRWEKENETRRLREAARAAARLRESKASLALAATKARLAVLAREQDIQETELEQLRLETVEDVDTRAVEEDALLTRRHADPAEALRPSTAPARSDLGEAGAP